jgi:hypothetical protein
MSQRHEGILARLSSEAVRALINTSESGWIAFPPGPAEWVVRQELLEVEGGPLVRSTSLPGTAVKLNIRGEVVRHYAMIKALENLG